MRCLLLHALLALMIQGVASAQWSQTAGPEGATFTAIVNAEGRTIASIAGSGIIRATAGGWEEAGPMVFGRIIAAGGALLGTRQETIYRSTDHGSTWTELSLKGMPYAIGADFYITANDTLHRSRDGGVTWSQISVLPQFTRALVEHRGALHALAGFINDTPIRSTDGGVTWDSSDANLPMLGLVSWELASASDALFAVVLGRSQAFRSIDGGITWSEVSAGLGETAGIAAITTNGSILWAQGNDAIYRFNGTSWERIAIASIPVAIAATDGGVLVAARGDAYRIADTGMTAVSIAGGLRNVGVTVLGALGDIVFASTERGLFRSADRGASWQHIAMLSPSKFLAVGTTIFALYDDVYRSLDGGITWEALGETILGDKEGFLHFNDIFENDGVIYVGRGFSFGEHGDLVWEAGGVFRSTDNGTTWREVSSGLPFDGISVIPVGSVIAQGNNVLAGTYQGVYRSTNQGGSWSRVGNGLPEKALGSFYAIGSTIYLVSSAERIFATTDGGAQWSQTPRGIPEEYTLATVLGQVDGKLYFYTYERRPDNTFPMHIYTFDGTVWEDITATLPPSIVPNAFVRAGTDLYAGTQGHSVWRKQFVPLSVDHRAGHDRTATLRCAPNPCSGETTVRFTLPSREHVSLTLVNALGEKVATVHEGLLDEGNHQRTIDVSSLPTGSYFIRLAHNGSVSVDRIIRHW